jgi:4-diphosphocytidyl-2-C-methyl-D-erythritol kinase
MFVKANAKINLGLNILSKRTDGFHELESVFLPISWYDSISFKEAEEVKFSSEGIQIPQTEKGNLCIQAYELLKADFQLPRIHIHLVKQIPIGAGLGGGSADTAFVLKALNEKYQLHLNIEQLEHYAAQLGSDCVFFIQNQSALVKGRGELIEVDKSLNVLKDYHLLMVKPDVFISTKSAYQNVNPKLPEKDIANILKQPIESWKDELKNDFEASLFSQYPTLSEIKQKLYDAGALYAAMSGSGSCLFGVFETQKVKTERFDDYLWKWVQTI